MLIDAAVLFAVALVGGLLPLLVRWNDRLLHAAISFSTGIFLGAVFLHLLPELSRLDRELAARVHAAAGVGGAAHGRLELWLFVLIGVLGVYFVEALVFRGQEGLGDVHRHRAVGYAAFVGLTIHALTTGIGFSLATAREHALHAPFLVALVAHKGFEAFSLTMVFLLAAFRRGRILAYALLFSSVTPLGILLGHAFVTTLGDRGMAIVTALAAGTFLFVCLCELLPEVFHDREDPWAKVLLLAAGVGVMVLFHGGGA